jgi:hypothetical protein
VGGRREAPVLRDVLHAFAVDPHLAIVAQRIEILPAGADTHLGSPGET